MIIAAIDPSLTGCAVAVGGATADLSTLTEYSSKPSGMLVAKRVERYNMLCAGILEDVAQADLILIEGYAFSQNKAGQHDIAEFGGILRHRMRRVAHLVVEISPGTIKKFITGKGNANKEAMLAAIIRTWDERDLVDTNNKADALGLFYLGCAALGWSGKWSKPKQKAVDEAASKIKEARDAPVIVK